MKSLNESTKRPIVEARIGKTLEDYLFDSIANKSYQQMSDEMGVCICTTRKWLRTLGLTKRLTVARV